MTVKPTQRDGTSLLINITTVAEIVGVSTRTIQRWVRDGKMPKPISPNGRPYWRRADIVEWVTTWDVRVVRQTATFAREKLIQLSTHLLRW